MNNENELKPISNRQLLTSSLAFAVIFGTIVYTGNRITAPQREQERIKKEQQYNRQATLLGKENLFEKNKEGATSVLYFDLDGDKKTDSVMLIQQTELSLEKQLAIVHDMKIGDTKKVIEWAKPFEKKGVSIISKYRTDHRVSYKELTKE